MAIKYHPVAVSVVTHCFSTYLCVTHSDGFYKTKEIPLRFYIVLTCVLGANEVDEYPLMIQSLLL